MGSTGIVARLAALGQEPPETLPLPRLAAIAMDIERSLEELTGSRNEGALRTAEALLRRCEAATEQQGVFSANESADDMATTSMPLLLTPFVLAELLCSASPCSSSDTPVAEQRMRMVHGALQAYSRFLHRLECYGLLGELAARQYAAEGEDEAGDGLDGSGAVETIQNPTMRRQAKIERFKQAKAIAAQLEQIRLRRAAAAGRGEDQEDGDGEGELGGPSGLDEEDERMAWLLRLEAAAIKSLEHRASLLDEQQLLRHAAAASAAAAAGPDDPRARRQAAERQAEEERQRARVMTGLAGVAAQLASSSAAGQGRGRAAAGGPASSGFPLSAAGGPVVQQYQPGGVQSDRERFSQGVFRPSHNLPTMTVEQFGRLEMQEAMEREQREKEVHAERERARVERTTGGGEYDEEEELRQREKDDWKDASGPRGWGNSALRPCGR